MAAKNSFRRRLALATILTFVIMLPLLIFIPAVFSQSSTTTTTSTTTTSVTNNDIGLGLIGAGLAIAGSCIGAGYAVGKAASSAAAAIVERPATFGPLLILAGLGEGIAIYGLLIAFQILSKIP